MIGLDADHAPTVGKRTGTQAEIVVEIDIHVAVEIDIAAAAQRDALRATQQVQGLRADNEATDTCAQRRTIADKRDQVAVAVDGLGGQHGRTVDHGRARRIQRQRVAAIHASARTDGKRAHAGCGRVVAHDACRAVIGHTQQGAITIDGGDSVAISILTRSHAKNERNIGGPRTVPCSEQGASILQQNALGARMSEAVRYKQNFRPLQRMSSIIGEHHTVCRRVHLITIAAQLARTAQQQATGAQCIESVGRKREVAGVTALAAVHYFDRLRSDIYQRAATACSGCCRQCRAEVQRLAGGQRKATGIGNRGRSDLPALAGEIREERVGIGQRVLRILLPHRTRLHEETRVSCIARTVQGIGEVAADAERAVGLYRTATQHRIDGAGVLHDAIRTWQRRVLCRQQGVVAGRQARRA
ncbi:hypothetical protein DyAD56_15445 [Dyella sp. AD56]|nr:hypothetical protein DyAD56_15445 [Dyella sp. AD56]